jgi:hypothetical protein
MAQTQGSGPGNEGGAETDARLLTALTTEHFVLQGALSASVAEAGARSTLYVMALSSSLVAMGFLVQTPAFLPFLCIVLPTLCLLGLFTTVRLVDTTLESQQHLAGIARIRRHYRTLSPQAAELFSPRHGRWPEAQATTPALGLGMFMAFLGTAATMIACINHLVAGAGVALLVVQLWGRQHTAAAVAAGLLAFASLTAAFLAYQRWRFATLRR